MTNVFMKQTILYGLSGEGSGHASRARALVPYLERLGYEVQVVGCGRATEQLKTSVSHYTDIFGFHISYKAGKADFLETFTHNLFASRKALRTILTLDKLVKTIKPVLVISDFEPFVSYTSYRHKIPLISVDNQHVLTNAVITKAQRNRVASLAAEALIRLVVPRAQHFFVTSFVPLKVKRKNTTIIPPIVDQTLQQYQPTSGQQVLVYMNNASLQDTLLPALEAVGDNFIMYGARPHTKSKLILKPFSRAGFLYDLANARAVIATAGFSLLSEALFLRKPFLALPSQDQFEQILNASQLESAGYGRAAYTDPTREDIESFLYRVPEFSHNLESYPFSDLEQPLKIIGQKVKEIARD